MVLRVQAEMPPLRPDSSGALRVGESRILLELVLHAFQDGATPEIIVQQYPTTTLSDVYAVIAYYLRHHQEMEEYLAQREKKSLEIQQKIETTQSDLSDLRKRLLAQRNSR